MRLRFAEQLTSCSFEQEAVAELWILEIAESRQQAPDMRDIRDTKR